MRYNSYKKFETKVLVWVAISERGISKVFMCLSSEAVNKEVYSQSCVKKRLKPFIDEYHSDGNYLFWPDLATAHTAKKNT